MPYRVSYYVHDMYSNYPDVPQDIYHNILFREEAQYRAQALLRKLKGYFHKHLGKTNLIIETYTVDNEVNDVYDTYR